MLIIDSFFFFFKEQQNVHSSAKLVGLNSHLNSDLSWKCLKNLPVAFLMVPPSVVSAATFF